MHTVAALHSPPDVFMKSVYNYEEITLLLMHYHILL